MALLYNMIYKNAYLISNYRSFLWKKRKENEGDFNSAIFHF